MQAHSKGFYDDEFFRDVFQDTALWIIQHSDRFDPQKGNFSQWFTGVYKMILFQSRHMLWRQNDKERQVIPIEGETEADAFDWLTPHQRHPSDVQFLQGKREEVLAKLTAEQKSLARYLIYEDCSRIVIAEKLDISYAALRQRITRLLTVIRSLRNQHDR